MDRDREGLCGRGPTGPAGGGGPYSLQQADFEPQPVEDLAQAVRVRQQAARVRDLGGVDLGVVVLHAGQTEHGTRDQPIRF